MTYKEAFLTLFKKKPKPHPKEKFVEQPTILSNDVHHTMEMVSLDIYEEAVEKVRQIYPEKDLSMHDLSINNDQAKIILEKYAPNVLESAQKPLNEKNAGDIIDDLISGGLI